MLMSIWRSYEDLGKLKFYEAAYLMGEKLSKSLYYLFESIQNCKLQKDLGLGIITKKNWKAYCKS